MSAEDSPEPIEPKEQAPANSQDGLADLTASQGSTTEAPSESETPEHLELGRAARLSAAIQSEIASARPEASTPAPAESPFEAVPGAALATVPAEVEEAEDLAQQSLDGAVGASFKLLRALMLLVALLMLTECLQVVDQGTVAVKRRFGRYLRDDQGRVQVYKADSRFVFVLPFPIEELEVVPLKTETMILDSAFWPKIDAAEAAAAKAGSGLPPRNRLAPDKDGYNLTGDANIVHSQWQLEYRVIDPVRYLSCVAGDAAPGLVRASATAVREKVEALLRRRLQGAVLRSLAGLTVDDALTGDPSPRILASLRARLDEDGGLGLEVTALNTRRIVPPGLTQAAFNEVTANLSRRKSLESQAQAKAAQIVAAARGQARRIKLDAEVEQRRRVEKLRADSAALDSLLAKFPNNPQGLRVYLEQRRQDALRAALAEANVYTTAEGQRSVLMVGPQPEERGGKEGSK